MQRRCTPAADSRQEHGGAVAYQGLKPDAARSFEGTGAGGTMQAPILLVEDNRDCEELALRALRKAGFNDVDVARDGAEALSKLLDAPQATNRCAPRFVLLDLKLPKIDGVDVLKRLRSDERTSGLKVFALSSSEDPREIDSCLSLGVVAVLAKPLDTNTLKTLLV